ncbi:Dullard family phosphatase domain-containing protein [Toxoplasma gondii RUB]|nr:Dullard family phosphatase domain-containing protein [Toxoplasma gondii GT1]KAF4640954.1 Dullard family phosphatase domain-containing protein [Toxoplasma gondii]KFG30934.1 Dullard family phosphatase domain-containing protein [Toxoplasma gondii GAB2-2007-GAL-DOM2]KFG34933.1 Dullard family phosphatase domain-containing protein [Toxoplasma gondii p89]KFG52546.1 Dullard family phosphatase domain-containing protein [Toxoplasma gondii FOU]KFG65588.1 Dullard family phosphatase domain-containing pr
MPNLCQVPKDSSQLLPALQSAIAYLALTHFPKKPPKLQHGYFLPPVAPQFAGRMTLVLDMDETLMHCATKPLEKSPAFLVRFSDTNVLGHVYVRPYTKIFLDLASQICEIVVFTASTQSYADQVLAHLDPDRRLVHHRLYRQHCTMINGGYVKDLRLLGRDISRVVLADNSPISMALQPDNGVLVSSWTSDDSDSELMDLLVLLQHVAQLDSVPEYLRERYGLREWINSHRTAAGSL